MKIICYEKIIRKFLNKTKIKNTFLYNMLLFIAILIAPLIYAGLLMILNGIINKDY